MLLSDRRDLSQDEQLALLEDFEQRHPTVDRKSESYKTLVAEDPFYNALQVKFGYALTCHKAQGGEWDHVIIDSEGVNTAEQSGLRWLYTALTRASKSVSLVQRR
ncbi:MAG: ATP-binding domain-containing protein [Nitrincola sp.]|nr:ATP-binding domain-containing protein [Nitrincola sp.]